MPVDAITLESSVGKSQDISLCQLQVLIFLWGLNRNNFPLKVVPISRDSFIFLKTRCISKFLLGKAMVTNNL